MAISETSTSRLDAAEKTFAHYVPKIFAVLTGLAFLVTLPRMIYAMAHVQLGGPLFIMTGLTLLFSAIASTDMHGHSKSFVLLTSAIGGMFASLLAYFTPVSVCVVWVFSLATKSLFKTDVPPFENVLPSGGLNLNTDQVWALAQSNQTFDSVYAHNLGAVMVGFATYITLLVVSDIAYSICSAVRGTYLENLQR